MSTSDKSRRGTSGKGGTPVEKVLEDTRTGAAVAKLAGDSKMTKEERAEQARLVRANIISDAVHDGGITGVDDFVKSRKNPDGSWKKREDQRRGEGADQPELGV